MQISLVGTPINNAAPITPLTKKVKERMAAKKKQGQIFVSNGGWHYDAPKYTVDNLKYYSESYYGSSTILKLCNLILPGAPEIRAIQPDGNEDTKLSTELMALSESEGVRLYEKMRFAFQDYAWAGFGIFNDTWDYDGTTYILQELRRLAPESFRTSDGSMKYVDPVFAGVGVIDDKRAFWQSDEDGTTQIIEPFYLLAPMSKDIAGTPLLKPLIPVIAFLQQGLQAVQQTVGRIGAPWMMLELGPEYSDDDVAYADNLLANWGKDSAFKLLPNMKIVVPPLPEPKTPIEAINMLSKMLIEYFSPASFIQNDNAAISSSDSGALSLFNQWTIGMQVYIEDAFERLLQRYLDANLYQGYHVEITLPRPKDDKTPLLLQVLDGFTKANIALPEEMRALFPEYLPELDETGIMALAAQRKQTASQPQVPVLNAVKEDRIIQMLQESLKA